MIKKLQKPSLLFFFAVLFTLPHFYNNSDSSKVILTKKEVFDPALSYCKSISSSIRYIDKVSGNAPGDFDTLNYVTTASQFIHKRFYHGTANYMFSENWIANLAGKYIWSHFYAIVIPNDILKRSKGLCNQQTTVFMELLKAKGISCRKIGLKAKDGAGHFFCEVRYNNSWHVYDVNIEPNWSRTDHPHESMAYFSDHREELYNIYEGKIPRSDLEGFLNTIEVGEPNEFPAKKMRLFHTVTKWFTYILPIFFLLAGIFSLLKQRKLTK